MITREIPLASGRGVALVDAADYALVADSPWRLHTNGYAITGSRTRYMHRLILAVDAGQEVDHVNGNRLDNRRANLRVASRSAQMRNTHRFASADLSSRYKGVCWDARRRRWVARIAVDGRRLLVAHSIYELPCAHAYDEAAREHYGEFARVNFPRDGEQSALRDAAA